MEIESEPRIPLVWESIFSRLYETPEVLQLTEGTQDLPGLLRANVSEARIVVFGGNRVGKSTFNKWIINKLLAKADTGSSDVDDPFVVYVDLDPGQAEFTPPGVISVLRIADRIDGPNYSHLTTPILSKFIGSLNVSDCVQTYLRCTEEIFQFLNSDESYRNVPWVINTMGFSRGLGVLLANLTICLSNPNVVIQIGLDGIQGEDKRTFPWLLTEDAVRNYVNNNLKSGRHRISANTLKPYQFVSINSVFCDLLEHARKKVWSVSAKDLRDQVLMKYFALATNETDDNNITAVIPRVVPFSSVALATMTSDSKYDSILRIINGNLVALCNIQCPEMTLPPSETKKIDKASRFSNIFYGYGIVRSIDKENKLLYIITPIEEDVLVNNVNCIVAAGAIGLPTQFYLHAVGLDEEGHELPYIQSKRKSKSKLNQATKKQFAPKRSAHTVLSNCLL